MRNGEMQEDLTLAGDGQQDDAAGSLDIRSNKVFNQSDVVSASLGTRADTSDQT